MTGKMISVKIGTAERRKTMKRLPRELKTIDVAMPLYLKGNNRGILVIHGFTGSPHEMRYLAHRLHEAGFSVSVPRLPGHGTCGEDFLNVEARDWIRRAMDSYFDLKGVHDKVGIVGLSMGGLIATIIAAQFEVDSLVLAAPAFHVSDKRIKFVPLMRFFRKKIARDPSRIPDVQENLENIRKEYWMWDWIAPGYQFLKVRKLALKSLKYLKCPTFIIASRKDTTVPIDGVLKVFNEIPTSQKEMLTLNESAHVVVNDVEKELVANRIIEWFSKTL